MKNMKRQSLLAAAVSVALAAPAFAAGNVTVDVDAGSRQLRITGDALDNDVEVTQDGEGSFTVTGKNGTTVNLLASASVTGVRSFFVLMGFGADRVELTNTVIRSDLKVRLDEGDDTLIMTGVRVRGRTAIRGGANADRVVAQGNCLFRFNVVIRTQDGNDTVNLENSDFKSRTRVDTGTGDDDMIVNECDFGGSARFEVDMRDGDDELTIDDSEFDDDVAVDMGRNDDHLTLESSDYNDDLRAVGSSGRDDLDLETNNDFRSPPRLRGWDD